MRILLRTIIPALAVACLGAPAAAQGYPESVQRWLDNCRDQNWGNDRDRACEVRALGVNRGTRALDIDGRTNGGVRVTAWDRDSIAVFAMVQTHAEDAATAQAIARDVRVSTSNGRIEADGRESLPRRAGYSVSYHIFAPRRTDVAARTQNGGITLDGIVGTVDVRAQNGGITMRHVGGDVRGRTTNGGITLALSGRQWEGRGVDLETTNGGVTVAIPERFNGRLETSTVNGGMQIDFPITVQGRIGRSISTTLGDGGPLVRVTTRNGGVRIRKT